MASNVSIGTNPITGRESYFGNVKLTPEQIRLINASPMLQSQLRDYGNDVNSGQMKPMESGDGVATFFDSKHIVLGTSNPGGDAFMLGTLSHEIGHYENRANDKAFMARYAVNWRDPEAFNVAALIGSHGEGEAVVNNWQVQQEIRKNTATGNSPGTQIDVGGRSTLQEHLDGQHAADVNAAESDTEDRNRLTAVGMNFYVNGIPTNALDETYYQYYGKGVGMPAPEPGRVKNVEFTGDKLGNINSMTERWASGDIGTQTFNEGRIQSSEMKDSQGNIISTAAYSYARKGGYSVDVRDGAGHVTKRGEFNADWSGAVRDYATDGSSQVTSSNAKNQTTRIVKFDAKGEKTAADYMVPDTGRLAVRDFKSADGGHTVSNCDAEGRVRSEFQYDRDGRPLLSVDRDENGQATFLVKYEKDGSRTVATVNADGSQTSHIVDKDGKRGQDFTLQPPEGTGSAIA